ncbi:MAG: hypothetical protein WD824_21600 [Cyclobacteriaceae bacterium]
MKFHIDSSSAAIRPEITYLLDTWARNQQLEISLTENPDDSITVGAAKNNRLRISKGFDLSTPQALNKSCFISDQNGDPDFLATAFYMLNSLQEYDDKDRDELNRFKFSNSYQYKFKNHKENIVQRCFDEIARIAGRTPLIEKTRFFLTHDIDLVNGAVIEDGFNVLKKGRIDLFLQMLFNVAIGRPDWLNMDKIMKIESEYDCKSVFFWIVNKGSINKREKNADYSFLAPSIQKQFNAVEDNGFENGIHKSISNETFSQEFEKYGRRPMSNRYHYLKFNLPRAYHDIERAGLKLDASLGFAEEIGFRNSYGLPFNPFNPETRKPFSFVEAPLHVMDRTYFQYKKFSLKEAEKDIFDFFERNRNNCVISVLWHNNFFTSYKFKGYLDLYKKILAYIKENDFETISQTDILKKYSII